MTSVKGVCTRDNKKEGKTKRGEGEKEERRIELGKREKQGGVNQGERDGEIDGQRERGCVRVLGKGAVKNRDLERD